MSLGVTGLDDSQAHPVRRRLARGAYLLPSLFTMGNILLGFYAIVRAYRGDYPQAALLIFAAAVLDALDGRIARLTGTESDFGREFDSLADVMTFGLAPAMISFLWGLHELGRVGWLVPLFFVVCTATRLARFNVQTDVVDKRFFVGLPSPAAAGAIVSLFFLIPPPETLFERELWTARAVLFFALVTVGSLMVSTFRYPSFKKLDLRQRWSYRGVLVLAGTVLVLLYQPKAFFFAAAFLYTLAGPVGWVVRRLRREGDGDGDGDGQVAEDAVDGHATAAPPPPAGLVR